LPQKKHRSTGESEEKKIRGSKREKSHLFLVEEEYGGFSSICYTLSDFEVRGFAGEGGGGEPESPEKAAAAITLARMVTKKHQIISLQQNRRKESLPPWGYGVGLSPSNRKRKPVA